MLSSVDDDDELMGDAGDGGEEAAAQQQQVQEEQPALLQRPSRVAQEGSREPQEQEPAPAAAARAPSAAPSSLSSSSAVGATQPRPQWPAAQPQGDSSVQGLDPAHTRQQPQQPQPPTVQGYSPAGAGQARCVPLHLVPLGSFDLRQPDGRPLEPSARLAVPLLGPMLVSNDPRIWPTSEVVVGYDTPRGDKVAMRLEYIRDR